MSLFKSLAPWGRLFRLPNLLTVPGDPIIGYVALQGAFNLKLLPLCACSLALYAYGLVGNDIADYAEDLADRPERPLPNGEIGKTTAKLAAVILLTAALLLAWTLGIRTLMAAGVLAILITLYNLLTKKHAFFGPFTLGLCRAGNIYLGIEAASRYSILQALPPYLYWLLPMAFFYIYCVSRFARDETRTDAGPRNGLSGVVAAGGAFAVFTVFCVLVKFGFRLISPLNTIGVIFFATLFGIACLREALSFKDDSPPLIRQKSVGHMLGYWLLFQATACAWFELMPLALILLIALIPARLAAKKFYAS